MTVIILLIIGLGLLGYYLWLKIQPEKKSDTALSPKTGGKFDQALSAVDTGTNPKVDNRLEGNVQKLADKYSPDEGAISSWFRTFQAEGRAKFLTALNEEQRQAIEQAVMLEKAVNEGRREAADLNTFIAANANAFLVLEAASDMKLPAEAFTRVREAEEMARIELDKHFAEQRETVRMALLSKELADHQKLFLIQELLDGIYREIHSIEQMQLSPALKERMIADREDTIKTLKEDKSGRESRLIQAHNGPDLRGEIPETVAGSDSSESD